MKRRLVRINLVIESDHTDKDCDLFSFPDLHRAMGYIFDENISDWIMSDMLLEEYQPEDYTFIE